MDSRVRLALFFVCVVLMSAGLVVIWKHLPNPNASNPFAIQEVTTSSSMMNVGTAAPSNQNNMDNVTSTLPVDMVTSTAETTTTMNMLCDPQNIICVSDEYQNSLLTNPIVVTGTAMVFENQFAWQLVGGTNNTIQLAQGSIMASNTTEGQPASFALRAFLPANMLTYSGPATLVFFESSPRDGQATHVLRIPIQLSDKTSSLKFYLSAQDSSTTCDTVKAMKVTVPRTKLPVEASLQALLAFSTTSTAGDVTQIPSDTQLISFVLNQGVATATFSPELDQGVDNSCRRVAISAQITQTLKQFSSVKQVVIIAQGKTADQTLQP